MSDKASIRFIAGHEKDVIRWYESASGGDRFTFLQAFTQRGKTCEIKSWLVSSGKLLPIGISFDGEVKPEDGKVAAHSCIFSLGDGDFSEKGMIRDGVPMRLHAIFELGQSVHIIHESSGSEGTKFTLYRLNANELEKLTEYYNHTMGVDFWRSLEEMEASIVTGEGQHH